MSSDTYMPRLCGNASVEWAFWSDNFVWNSPNPNITSCFKYTILQWILVAYVIFLSPLHIHKLRKKKTLFGGRVSIFNIVKVLICMMLCFLGCMDLFKSVSETTNGYYVLPVLYLQPVLNILLMVTIGWVTYYEYTKGEHSTGFLFLFWFLNFILGLINMISRYLNLSYQNTTADYRTITFTVSFSLITIQLAFHFFADYTVFDKHRHRNQETHHLLELKQRDSVSSSESVFFTDKKQPQPQSDLKPCPELTASFPARISWYWLLRMIIRGYRRTLTGADLFGLRPDDSCEAIVPRLEKEWKKELQKFPQISLTNPEPSEDSSNSVKYTKLRSNSESENKRKGKKEKLPSIYATLGRQFGLNYLLYGFYKLLTDSFTFIQPPLLKLLISFVNDPNDYVWHGFVFAISLYLVAMVRTFFMQQYWHGCMVVGMRLRTAVSGIVYRKALKLSGSARKNTTVGEIVNLMSVDTQRLQDAPSFLHILWTGPISMIVAMVLLWQELGASILAGLAVMIMMVPINGVVASKVKKLQFIQMRLKDQRMKQMNEILSGIKVLKLYAWEPSFEANVNKIRDKELINLRHAAFLNVVSSVSWFCAPFLVALTTFATFVLSSPENILTSEKAFVALALFNIMNFPLAIIPGAIAYLIQMMVSIGRIRKFLLEEELDITSVEYNRKAQYAIEIDNGSFNWERNAVEARTLSNINIKIPIGSLTAVVGTVGCGKTSLISSILGEMYKVKGKVCVNGNVAYVPQQAWCQNCTVKDNILFGKQFSSGTYEQVLNACALKEDLKILPGGDMTEIGEKGINLSGGQKQRVSLARAVYQNADIYLLDDPLSAVDSHVGKHIFEKVIGDKGILNDKTRILVTHGLSYLPKADCILVIKDGQISETGTYNELLNHNGPFAEFIKSHLESEDEDEEDNLDPEDVTFKRELLRQISVLSGTEMSGTENEKAKGYASSDGGRSMSSNRMRKHSRSKSTAQAEDEEFKKQQKNMAKLTTEETSETGNVKWSVFMAYISALGKKTFSATFLSYLCYIGSSVGTNFWLSIWSEDGARLNGTQDADLTSLRLGIYGALGFAQTLFTLLMNIGMAFACFSASRHLHAVILKNIMRTPMSFFDTTPLGRILNRFGKDIDTVDLAIPMTLRGLLVTMGNVIGTIIVVSVASPQFLIAMVPLGVAYYFAQRFYICTSRQLKRIDSVRRSPIYSHFQESVVGAASIRAYRKQEGFIMKSDKLIDENQMAYYPTIVSYRWLGITLETIGNFVILLAALFAVILKGTMNGGLAGLSVTYSLQVTGFLNMMVRMTCDMEAYIVSVERIQEYTEVPNEAPWKNSYRPRDDWPNQGYIEFKNYSVRYRPGLDLIIKDFSAVINPKHRVGIVGRTGAGKSSLTLALFRILEPANGTIEIDGVDIRTLGLHDLRSKITIIPQDPVLFSGTLRMNLDPFNLHSDGEVWLALEHAHLKQFVVGLPDGLKHMCSEGGDNLSVGQRQLVCLARALLRKTSILVLDEATAAVDMETDDLIQTTIRSEFKDCTVLTIAHRLNTIMDYNSVMVLDKGRLKEYDSPANLLKNTRSIFYGMARDAGLV